MDLTSTILIVDDEANIRAFLKEILEQDNYRVSTVASGEAALQEIKTQTFDLALIDLKLPGLGGIEVLKGIRVAAPETVIIVLTAHASLETAVEALRHGAHDYLFKPCQPVELHDSIRRGLLNRQKQGKRQQILERLQQVSTELEVIRATIIQEIEPAPALSSGVREVQPSKRFLQRQGITVDMLRHIITIDERLLDTTPTEFDLLVYLLREAPRVISPQELIHNIQGYQTDQWEASNIIRRHVHRLRQKIKELTGNDDLIQTVRGVGYTLQ